MLARRKPEDSHRSVAEGAFFNACVYLLCFVVALAAFIPLISSARAEAQASVAPVEAAAEGIAAPEDSTVWYLAEGFTGGAFDTYVLVQNPGGGDADVTLSFQLPPGSQADPYSFTLPAGTRQSILLDGIAGLGNTDVSTKVTSSVPVVAERAMYFDYNGKTGRARCRRSEVSLQCMVPGRGLHRRRLRHLGAGAEPGRGGCPGHPGLPAPAGLLGRAFHQFDLPAGTRKSINLDTLPGLDNTDVSTKVTSTTAGGGGAGHVLRLRGQDRAATTRPAWQDPPTPGTSPRATPAATSTPTCWCRTRGQEAASVTFDFQLPPGSSAPPLTLRPTREDQAVDHAGRPHRPGQHRRLHQGDLETRRWWRSGPCTSTTTARPTGTIRTGADAPATDWYLAEGYTGGDFDTYVLVQNPGQDAAKRHLRLPAPAGVLRALPHL